MDFIKAFADNGNQVYINPNYIIEMSFVIECEDFLGNKYDDHYVIVVDLGNKTEELHISLEVGNKLLSGGEIEL